MYEDPTEQTVLDKVLRLQDGLVAHSTGGAFAGGDADYERLRMELIQRSDVRNKLPRFVHRYRDLSQFWQFIKHEYAHYAERRTFIWDSFRPLVDYLEALDRFPGVEPIGETLSEFDIENVHSVWQKALDRRTDDPEGAITAARTLLETVCKHILDDMGVEYGQNVDLPKLWALCAKQLNLAPHQHSEKVFKTILGNCQSIVNTIASIRNKISDAHGQGRRPVKPKPRHAELAVNLAGTMAAFLVETWKQEKDGCGPRSAS